MSMFLFRPHIQGPVGITTPDLIVDHLRLNNEPSSTNLLTSNCYWQTASAAPATCALALTSAGAGPLISPALILPNGMISVARRAWRWKYVENLTHNGTALSDPLSAQCQAIAEDLNRCQMHIVTLPEEANELCLQWQDQQLCHKLFIDSIADITIETEKPRYSVGPMRHPVDHFV